MERLNLCIDQGNTRIKTVLFDGDTVVNNMVFDSIKDLNQWINSQRLNGVNAIYSSSSDDLSSEIELDKVIKLNGSTPLPVKIAYDSPETLGNDRKANVCAAWAKFPGKNSVVIDAGTCITFDLINAEGIFLGGAISPGILMRARAMHHFTARLPLIEGPFENLTSGNSTRGCIHSGALHGSVLEVRGRTEEYSQQFDNLHVLLTGGDALYFDKALKTPTFADSILTLRGLNEILKYQK